MSSKRACSWPTVRHACGSHQRWPVSCDFSTTPLSCGVRGGLKSRSMPKPTSHKANAVGKSFQLAHGKPLSRRNCSGRPHPAKTCLNCACTVVGGTWFQTEGGNDRLQDGPGAFIDPAQPTHQLAGG